MHMFFWFGSRITDFLFHGYNIVTLWGFISTCLGLSALAVLFEAMKVAQIKLHSSALKYEDKSSNDTPNTDSSSLISRVSEKSEKICGIFWCNKQMKWFWEVVHWSLHVALGYFMMLAVMTYNGYVSIAIIIGSGIGYFVFGPVLLEKTIEGIQKSRKSIQCNPECADSALNNQQRESTESMREEPAEPELHINTNADVHTQSGM